MYISLKRKLSAIITSFSIFLSILTPYQAIAKNQSAPELEITMESFLKLSQNLNNLDRKELAELDNMLNALNRGQLKDLPMEVIDPFNFVGQKVVDLANNEVYDIAVTNKHVPFFRIDTIEFGLEDGKLTIYGKNGNKNIVEHIFENLEVTSIFQDHENVYFITKDKKIYLLEKRFARQYAFRTSLPTITLYHAKSDTMITDKELNESTKITQIGRGIEIFSIDEVEKFATEQIDQNDVIIPQDEQKRPVIKTGQIVIYNEQKDGSRRVEGIFSNEAISGKVHKAMTFMAAKSAAATHAIYTETISETMRRYWNTDTVTENKGQSSFVIPEYHKFVIEEAKSFIDIRDKLNLYKTSIDLETAFQQKSHGLQVLIDGLYNKSGIESPKIDFEDETLNLEYFEEILKKATSTTLSSVESAFIDFQMIKEFKNYDREKFENLDASTKKVLYSNAKLALKKFKKNANAPYLPLEKLKVLLDAKDKDGARIGDLYKEYENKILGIQDNTSRQAVEGSALKYSRDSVIDMIDHAKVLQSKANNSSNEDISSLEWHNSQKIVFERAPETIKEIDLKIPTLKISEKPDVQKRRDFITEGLNAKNLNASVDLLLTEHLSGKSYGAYVEQDFFDKILNIDNLKRVTKITAIAVAASIAAHVGIVEIYQGSSVWFQTYINTFMNSDFHRIVTDAEYKWIQRAGVVTLLSLYPLIIFASASSVKLLDRVRVSADLAKMKAVGSFKVFAEWLSTKSHSALKKYKNLDVIQAMITFMAKIYALMIKLFPTYYDMIFGQHIMETMARGKSPLSFMSANHPLLSKEDYTKLRANGKAPKFGTFLSTNLPGNVLTDAIMGKGKSLSELKDLYDTNNASLAQKYVYKRKSNLNYKTHLLNDLEKEAKRVTILANGIASLLMATDFGDETEILKRVMEGRHSVEDMINQGLNKEIFKKFNYLAENIHSEILKQYKPGTIEFVKNEKGAIEFKEDLVMFFIEKGKKYTEDIKNNKFKWKKYKTFAKPGFSSLWKGIAGFGDEQFALLNSVVANKFVSNQTNIEWLLDHAMVAGITAYIGERANLEDAHLLAHTNEWTQMFSTLEHLNDAWMNCFIHALMAGPRNMLVYQNAKNPLPPEIKADRLTMNSGFSPKNDALLEFNKRPEKIGRSLGEWIYSALNFKMNNFGGYFNISVYNYFKTIQASMIFNLVFRYFFTEQTISEAFMAFALFWLSAYPSFAWPWVVVSRGNHMEEERVENSFSRVKAAVDSIYEAAKNDNIEDMDKAFSDLLIELEEGKNISQKDYLEEFKSALETKGLKTNKIDDLKINELMYKNNGELLKQLAIYIEAKKAGDKSLSDSTFETIDNIIASNGEFKTTQSVELRKEAIVKATDLVLKFPAKFNAQNPKTAWFSSFFLGAVLTTYLAISLQVDSFNVANLNFATLAERFVVLMAFMGGTFLGTSQWAYENIYYKSWETFYDKVLRPIRNKYKNVKDKVKSYRNQKATQKAEEKSNKEGSLFCQNKMLNKKAS
ncbi:MAG: hypothetical protein H6622_15605 [Halobacteriovoraceae bacterium]|nr:hypothetical protein [Halobacteriovoraceae bacterium]